MRSIIPVNTLIPGHGDFLEYEDGKSLQDYDIVLFDPSFPYYPHDSFTDGSTALSVTSGKEILTNVRHWKHEISNAINDGKTVFVIVTENIDKTYKTGGSTTKGRTTTYNTSTVNNYTVLPTSFNVINSSGSKIQVVDDLFKDIYNTLKSHIAYKAYIPGKNGRQAFTNMSGSNTLGSVISIENKTGHIVLLPYFNLSNMTKESSEGEELWTNTALGIGNKLVKHLVEIDKVLRNELDSTPAPDWLEDMPVSIKVSTLSDQLLEIEEDIEEKEKQKTIKITEIDEAVSLKFLLYENGAVLEKAIDAVLVSLGYSVSNFREGSLEIDHVIVSPEGKRLIGETEGKDKSAIGISKFRQLESNINEDFDRETVTEPAAGILFGNGFRLIKPTEREKQFTDKCLTNAQRLGTVLVNTSDLYQIAIYLQDNDDEVYKKKCRSVLESSAGKIAKFPKIPNK